MRCLRVVVAALIVFMLASCTGTPPLKREDLVHKGREYLDRTSQASRELPHAWTLEEAVARALSAHVDFRIARLEAAIATGNRKLATFDLLPELTLQAGYQRRSQAEQSTSSDKETRNSQISASWDVLDFSVAYFRQRELADQEHASEENRRRVAQLTLRDAAYAWYQVRTWQELAPELVKLRQEVQDALRQSDEIVRQRLGNPIQAVEYRSALLLVLRRIDSVMLQLDQARDQLGQMLHLPAGSEVLVSGEGSVAEPVADVMYGDVSLWQAAGLINRPELRQQAYDSRALRTGAVRRLVEALPRLVFRTGRSRDNNVYLARNEWNNDSAQLSLDLVRLASLPGLRRNLRLSRELADLREQSIAAAVVMQVSIAGKAYERNRNSWCLSRNLLEVDQQRSALLEARSQVASLDNLTRLRSRLDSLLLRTEAGLQQAEMYRARLSLLYSAGLLEVPENTDPENVAAQLRELLGTQTPPAVREELQRVAGEFELATPEAAAASGDEGTGESPAGGCGP